MTEQSEWVSLGEAAKLLGVHPTTVRNWADQGEIPFRRTPGQHRRFQRSALEKWAAQRKDKERTSSSATNPQVIVEYALGRTRFGVGDSDIAEHEWYARLSPEGVNQSRAYGRRLLEALLHHLQDETPEGEELVVAQQLGRDYATFLKGEGLTLVQAVRGFVYFDNVLVESVVRISAPTMTTHPSEWSDLLQQINAFTNEVLVTMISEYLR